MLALFGRRRVFDRPGLYPLHVNDIASSPSFRQETTQLTIDGHYDEPSMKRRRTGQNRLVCHLHMIHPQPYLKRLRVCYAKSTRSRPTPTPRMTMQNRDLEVLNYSIGILMCLCLATQVTGDGLRKKLAKQILVIFDAK